MLAYHRPKVRTHEQRKEDGNYLEPKELEPRSTPSTAALRSRAVETHAVTGLLESELHTVCIGHPSHEKQDQVVLSTYINEHMNTDNTAQGRYEAMNAHVDM